MTQRSNVTAFFISMGKNQKEIGKQQKTPDNFAFSHCLKAIECIIARNVKIAYRYIVSYSCFFGYGILF